MLGLKRSAGLILATVFLPLQLIAQVTSAGQPQTQPPRTFTLQEAVNYALAHYPAIQGGRNQVEAARGVVDFARTDYLPQLNSLWQANRATSNNVMGIMFPQSVVPSVRGPVLPSSSATAWGSIGGLLFSWQPYAFGYRHAKVNLARAGVDLASANLAVTRLAVAANAMNAFFNLVAAEQGVSVAEANLRHWQAVNKSVHTLVDQELRPGADASRADAQLAQANIQLIQAQQQMSVNRVAMAGALGLETSAVEVSAGPLLGAPPKATLPVTSLASHPAAVAQQSSVKQAQGQLEILRHSFYPDVYVQSFVSGIGSGFSPTGVPLGGGHGLGLGTENYGAAVTITFPIFSILGIHAQEKSARANVQAQTNYYRQALLGINDQVEQAQAMLDGARRVAENTPIQLNAARTGEIQSQTRYKAGLTTIVELADAESLLEEAEIEDALARLAVWHNLANLAAAEGDLGPFFQMDRTGGH
ncbi:MAG: TolC family protein [Acidobacteria bacterium]|nr:MAG: TolC family protein [Acidobacteriota bacterium]